MRNRLPGLVFATLVLASGCEGGSGVALDCDAAMRLADCETFSGDNCACDNETFRHELKTAINECGSKSTCADMDACFAARSEEAGPRTLDQQIEGACTAYANRCQLDARQECGGWTELSIQVIFSESILTDFIDCYSGECRPMRGCDEFVAPQACRRPSS